MTQRIIDGTLSVLASIVGFALSWPFWRDFEYWPESREMWWLYFVVGFVLAVYVFYVFIRVTRTLFEHDAIGKAAARADAAANDKAGAP
ncbi:hypothetical protein [Dokdonella sp.]|uniref:hypothetical protein n=1 Tax=Dokdonella sp. TaxID=2291710 RepID=UPI0031C7DF0B|nr:hypothetical protein [Dokdonella sp.]